MTVVVYRNVFWNGKLAWTRYNTVMEKLLLNTQALVAMGFNEEYFRMDYWMFNIPRWVFGEKKVYWTYRKPDPKFGFIDGHFKDKGYEFSMEFKDGRLAPKGRYPKRADCRIKTVYGFDLCYFLKKMSLRLRGADDLGFPRMYYGPITTAYSDYDEYIYTQPANRFPNGQLWESTSLLLNKKTRLAGKIIKVYPAETGVFIRLYDKEENETREDLVLSFRKLSNPMEYHIMRGYVLIDPEFRIVYDLYRGIAYEYHKDGVENGYEYGHFEKTLEFKPIKDYLF